MLLRNPKNNIKSYLNIFSAHFSLFRNVVYTVRQYHVTDYRVDFSNLSYSVIVSVLRTVRHGRQCVRPCYMVRIRVGLLREETSALDCDCRKCIQSRALVPFRVCAHPRNRTSQASLWLKGRCGAPRFASCGWASRGASRASPRRHPRAAGGGSLWHETGTCHTRRTATSW